MNGVCEGVPKETGLALKGFAGIAGMAHEDDFLTDQAGDMHDVALAVGDFAAIEQMVAIDIDDVRLCEGLRAVRPKMVHHERKSLLADLEFLDHGAGAQRFERRTAFKGGRIRLEV